MSKDKKYDIYLNHKKLIHIYKYVLYVAKEF